MLGVASVTSGLRESGLHLVGAFAMLRLLRGGELGTRLELVGRGSGLVGISPQVLSQTLDLRRALGCDPFRLGGGLTGAVCLVALAVELRSALGGSSFGPGRRSLRLLEMRADPDSILSLLGRLGMGDLRRRLEFGGEGGRLVRCLGELIPQPPDLGCTFGGCRVTELLEFGRVIRDLGLRQPLRHGQLGLERCRVGPGLPGVRLTRLAPGPFGIEPPLEFVDRPPARVGLLLRGPAQAPLLGELVKTSTGRRQREVERRAAGQLQGKP